MKTMSSVFLLFLISGRVIATGDPYRGQPRITIEDGHLIFQTAENRNISFLSTGTGSIRLNGKDLVETLNLANSYISDIQEIKASDVVSVRQTADRLQRQWADSISRIIQLEQNVTTLANQISQLSDSGDTGQHGPRGIRRLTGRVRSLELQIAQLTQRLTRDNCSSNPCRNGATCVTAFNGYHCLCPSNWEGSTCENDVNECARFIGTSLGCQNGATCINTLGGYRCECTSNWRGVHCAEQHNDCSVASHQELCGHGTCINIPRTQPNQPKYKCICEQGWTTDEINPMCVVDVDECSSPHPACSRNPPVSCINRRGTFTCGPCPAGYTGDGFACSDIDECQANNGGCSMNPFVQCINTVGSRVCGQCPPGYIGDGIHCTFTEVCHINNGGCHPLATCTGNTAISGGYRECRCPSGYVGDGVGSNGCMPAAGTTCSSNPCVNGNCLDVGTSFVCTCRPGYTGTLCNIAINECVSNPCRNGGTCVDELNSYTCVCPSDWEGTTCEQPKESCGGYLNTETGSFRFPSGTQQQYPNDINCAWVIVGSEGKVLNITFHTFHLEYSPSCSYDFLQVNDGPTAGSHPIGRFCGTTPPGNNGVLISSHNQIYMWFHSDHSSAGDGFEVVWNSTDPVCGGELPVADYGSINSPGYPGNYPHMRDCYWIVRVPFGKRIQFHFATLQIETHENCSFDYLQIRDGVRDDDPVLDTYCHTVTPPPLLTSGPRALVHFHSDESLTDRGFHITYAAVPGVHGCGGTLTAPKGSFSTPNFPELYQNGLECDWLIRVHPNDRLQLTFQDFELERHGNCRWDYVEIYDGEDENAALLGRYCGNNTPPVVISTSNKLFVKFYTDISVTRRGFRAEYYTICGGIYTGSEGVLHSPYYPDNYPASSTCLYRIHAPQGYIINMEFHDFDVEDSSSCHFDFLQVRDGDTENSTLFGTFCGTSLPNPIRSSFNSLWMKFVTDGSVHNKGFYANYTSLNIGCGGLLTESHGSISTPGHPFRYRNQLTCMWLLRAPVGYVIRLTFVTFHLESHTNCRYDYVEVNGIGRFCGHQVPPTLTSVGNELLVKFISDISLTYEGFLATYAFFDASQVCGGEFFNEAGVIKSPLFPRHYPRNRRCTWLLHAANGHQIMLNTTTFHLENHTNCNFDYLEIRNGGTETSPLVGKYCGVTIDNPITSHSNTLRITFVSDGSMSAEGFQIFYDGLSTGCGGTVTSPTGSISSPNYPLPYGHNAECTWSIRVSKGSVISVFVTDVDIEEHSTCEYDSLQVFDGDSAAAPRLLHLCNNQQNPGPVTSTGNKVFVKFLTDSWISGRGFNLVYHQICNNMLNKRRGVIESPNFPNPYPHNHNCSWKIRAPVGNNVTVAFTYLSLEAGECEHDYVEVLEEDRLATTPRQLGKFCGNPAALPPVLETSTNTAIINFVTDSSDAYAGFRLEWNWKGCGGELTKSYTYFTSPNYPNGYPLQTSCMWHLSTTPGSRIELHIVDFDLEAAPDCTFDFVKVYGGEDETSPLLTQICHRESGERIVTSMGNKMLVHFYSDYSVQGKGFRAFFRTITGGCGGVFRMNKGNITSPNYPGHYGSTDDCSWLITVDGFHLVELQFDAFDFPESPNCTSGYLEVHDGSDVFAPLLVKKCGGDMPPKVTSTANTLYVHMKTDGHTSANGFSARYTSACGARIKADEAGSFTSPNYPHHSIIHYNCSWILYSSDLDQRVTVIFTNFAIHPFNNCSEGYVEVRDGQDNTSPLLNKFCGYHAPPPITSEGNALHVFMNSIGLFRATYSTSSSACGGTMTALSGAFNSPWYPNGYPMNTECIWDIQSPPGNQVQLTFSVFNIEESDYCNMDYVEVRQHNSGGPLIGRYCGTQLPRNVTILNRIWVKFRSDEYGSAPGFMAQYVLVHGMDLSGETGQIASPGYPHTLIQEGEYTWRVMVPQHMFVNIVFLEMDIGYSSGQECYSSFLKVYDGLDSSSPEIGTYCGNNIPDSFVTRSSVATIEFVNGAHSYGLWRLRWTAVNETTLSTVPPLIGGSEMCGEEIFLNNTSSFTIDSPGYPNGYTSNLNCTWLIHTSEPNHILLRIDDMNIEGINGSCYYDRLKVYAATAPNSDSWSLLETLCGRFQNHVLSSTTNLMKVTFLTNSYYNLTGFRTTARSVCGGLLAGPTGQLKSENFGYQYQQCEWFLTVRPGRTIRVTFDSFNIYGGDNVCSRGYIMFRNGGHATSPILGNGKYCGDHVPELPESSSNQMYMKLMFQYPHIPHFVMNYNEVSVGCGGSILLNDVNSLVEINSPGYPSPPPHDIECDWIILSPSERRMRLDFESDFDMDTGCQWFGGTEFVEVFDGGTINSPSLGRFCGVGHQSSVQSTGDSLLIRYVTSAQNPRAGFKAKIRVAECGGTISSYFGYVTSPNFPGNYGNNQECEWLIVTHEMYVLRIRFINMDLPTTENCNSGDNVEIRDRNATGELLGRFCGSNTRSITSLGNIVYIKFKSDSSETRTGFKLLFTLSAESCGGQLTTQDGVLTSPNFPDSFPNARYCRWVITAPVGRRISVTFTHLNLRQSAAGVCIDSIRIMNGSLRGYFSEGAHLLCGSVLPDPVLSLGMSMSIVLYTRGLAAGEGFSLTYNTDQESLCGGILPYPSGHISSPWYEESQPYSIECIWELSASKDGNINHTTVIQFHTFNIPRDHGCYGEFVSVAQGPWLSTSAYHRLRSNMYRIWRGLNYCGNLTDNPPRQTFSYPYVTTIYVASSPQGGFNATYNVQECGGMVNGREAFITSPNYPNNYPLNSDCQWVVELDAGEQINLTASHFHLESDCDKDYLMIRNGPYVDSPVIGKYCGTNKPSVISESSALTLQFHSDGTGSGSGFLLNTTAVTRGCGGIFHRTQGTISSPGYPNLYPNRTECEWRIEYPHGYSVLLNFTGRFDIEMHSNCDHDYVLVEEFIEDVWNTLKTLCGARTPDAIISTSNKVRITFHTNDEIQGDGFQLLFSRGCGGIFTEEMGIITSPDYPDNYPNNVVCNYLIQPHGDRFIGIEFEYFDVEESSGCIYDSVTVYQGNTTSAQSLQKHCGISVPGPFSSRASMLIVFSTDFSVTRSGFRAKYAVSDCGGDLTSPSGVFHSPSHPSSYLNNMRCTWFITVEPNRVIELKFINFDIEAHPSCAYDYVDVRDGSNMSATLIGHFCGRDLPPTIKSSNNSMVVHFWSDYIISGVGFKAAYRTTYGEAQGCGGLIESPSGEVNSFDADDDGNYELNVDCVWHIIAAEDKIVRLVFQSMDIEQSPNNTCTFDYVQIIDGLSPFDPIISKFCGQALPNPIIASSNKLLLHFHSDDQGNAAGFRASFTSQDPVCGGILIPTESNKTLTSPSYPEPYPNVWCRWMIQTGDDKVEVTFLDFDVSCGGNYLQLKSEATYWSAYAPHRYCGHSIPHEIYSNGLSIIFSTGSNVVGRGFSLTYKHANCSRKYHRSNGAVLSPRYPAYYPSEQECVSVIEVEPGYTIALYFLDFRLASWGDNQGCNNHVLNIREGRNASGHLLASVCGTTLPNPVFSTTNALWLQTRLESGSCRYFISYTSTDKGRGCGGNLTHMNGTFTSPLYPSAYNLTKECRWYLTVPGSHTMTLTFRFFSLSSSIGCDTNYLEVYDSHREETSNFVNRFCGNDFPAPYTSQGNTLLVKLATSSNNTGLGFRAEFHMDSLSVREGRPVLQATAEPVVENATPDILDMIEEF